MPCDLPFASTEDPLETVIGVFASYERAEKAVTGLQDEHAEREFDVDRPVLNLLIGFPRSASTPQVPPT